MRLLLRDFQRIIDRAGQNNWNLYFSAVTSSNDTSGSPELINTYLNNSHKASRIRHIRKS